MSLRRWHLTVGVVFLLVFVATGAVMKFHDPPLEQLDPFLRMLFRSRHLYLMFAASSNALLGLYWRGEPGGAGYVARAGSGLVLVAPLLALLGFARDPAAGTLAGAAFGKLAAFALFGGTVLHLLAGLVAAARGRRAAD